PRRAAGCAICKVSLLRQKHFIARRRKLPNGTGAVDSAANDDDVETIKGGRTQLHASGFSLSRNKSNRQFRNAQNRYIEDRYAKNAYRLARFGRPSGLTKLMAARRSNSPSDLAWEASH